MAGLRVILPKQALADPAKVRRAVERGLNESAEEVKTDFEKTVSTWQHKPAFRIEKREGQRTVGTEDENYARVSGGTRAHRIRARGRTLAFPANHQAKTTPRIIASRPGGSSGPIVYTREVMHPGTQARQFEQVIAEKHETEFGRTMQRNIDEVFR